MSHVSADEAVAAVDKASPRRPSIEKSPMMTSSDFDDDDDDDDVQVEPTAFDRLPDEIIQQ